MNSPVKIDICYIGNLPIKLNRKNIERKFKSLLWEINNCNSIQLSTQSDLQDWAYSDKNILSILPKIRTNCDIMVCIGNFPIEDNYFARRIFDNIMLISFHEVKDYLDDSKIPLENLVLRCIYAAVTLYEVFGRQIPSINLNAIIGHHDTRGCIFDKCGLKYDVISSCCNPILCDECIAMLKEKSVSIEFINRLQQELNYIKKPMYYRFIDFSSKHPILTFVMGSLYTFLLGVSAAIIVSFF